MPVGERPASRGVLLPGVNAPVPGGRTSLAFEPRLVPENTPMAPLDGLQTAMREGEARLAEALGDEAEVVVLDGPLTFLGSTTAPIVGLVKRLMRPYLAPAEAGLLRRLEVGTRTPLFLIADARGGQGRPRRPGLEHGSGVLRRRRLPDLYVASYIDCTLDDVLNAKRTLDWRGLEKVAVGPFGLKGAADRFFRSVGGKRFVDATAEAGLQDRARGRATDDMAPRPSSRSGMQYARSPGKANWAIL